MGRRWDRLVHVCQCHLTHHGRLLFRFLRFHKTCRSESGNNHTSKQRAVCTLWRTTNCAIRWRTSIHQCGIPCICKQLGIQTPHFIAVSFAVKWKSRIGSQHREVFSEEIGRPFESGVGVAKHAIISNLTARQILRRKVKKQKMSQQYYDRNARHLSPLRRRTPAFVQSLKKYDASKWAQGMDADQCSKRSYIVEIEGRLLLRNRRYLRTDHTIRPTPSTSTEQEGHRDGTHSRYTHLIPTDEKADLRELESCEMPAIISTPRLEPVPTSPVKAISPVKTRSGRLIKKPLRLR